MMVGVVACSLAQLVRRNVAGSAGLNGLAFWRYLLGWPVAERTVMAIAMKGFHPLHIKCGEDEQAFHFAVP
jgi:hypothetical protein